MTPCYQIKDQPQFIVLTDWLSEAIHHHSIPGIGEPWYGAIVTGKEAYAESRGQWRVVLIFEPPMIGEGI